MALKAFEGSEVFWAAEAAEGIQGYWLASAPVEMVGIQDSEGSETLAHNFGHSIYSPAGQTIKGDNKSALGPWLHRKEQQILWKVSCKYVDFYKVWLMIACQDLTSYLLSTAANQMLQMLFCLLWCTEVIKINHSQIRAILQIYHICRKQRKHVLYSVLAKLYYCV